MRNFVRSIGRPAARTSSSTPHSRKISIVRMLMLRAFGWRAVLGRRSTSCERTPRRESRIEALNPTGPPPTIKTGTSIMAEASRAAGLFPAAQTDHECELFGELGGLPGDHAPRAVLVFVDIREPHAKRIRLAIGIDAD